MSTNNPEIKYTKDGRKVSVVGTLNSEQRIVQEIFVSGDQEFPGGENFVVSSLLDEPAESWKDKKLRELEERFERDRKEWDKRIEQQNNKMREACEKAKHKAAALLDFASNSDNEQLQRLNDFLAGEITHFFILGMFNPKIVEWDDDAFYGVDRWHGCAKIESLRLVSLFGSSKGDLSFHLNRYSDGSGGWEEIVPCRSYDEALAEAQKRLDELAYRYVNGDRPGLDLDEWAQIEGIRIPEDALRKQDAKREERRNKRIAELEKQLSDLRGEQEQQG